MPSGWLQPIHKGLKQFPDAGFIGNVQKNPKTNRYDHFGVAFPPWLTPIHYGQHLKKSPKLIGSYSRWAAVTAACVLIKKEVFLSAGGFNENYINGCEDMDLCIRLHKMGYWHYVAHESEIFHHKGSSSGRKEHNDANLKRFKSEWNEYLYSNIIARDKYLAAHSYLRSCMSYPKKTNLVKLLKSIKTLVYPRNKTSLKLPEYFN